MFIISDSLFLTRRLFMIGLRGLTLFSCSNLPKPSEGTFFKLEKYLLKADFVVVPSRSV
jgi:hypothetical protein